LNSSLEVLDSPNVTTTRNYLKEVDNMRLQLALNVDDLDQAVEVYNKMFAAEPLKRKPGYANYAIEQPPLKLVLFEGAGPAGSINHLGVEVETADQVVAAEARLSDAGLETTGVDETVCCFAEKAETWLHGPDNTRWEWYVKKADTEQGGYELVNKVSEGSVSESCCGQADTASCC